MVTGRVEEKMDDREEHERKLNEFLSSHDEFKHLVQDRDLLMARKGFDKYNDIESYKFHASSSPAAKVYQHKQMLRTSSTYRNWYGRQGNSIKSMISKFDGKHCLRTEWNLSIDVSDEELVRIK